MVRNLSNLESLWKLQYVSILSLVLSHIIYIYTYICRDLEDCCLFAQSFLVIHHFQISRRSYSDVSLFISVRSLAHVLRKLNRLNGGLVKLSREKSKK